MTVLADNREKFHKEGKLLDYEVVASDIIYKGAIVKINAAGNAAPMAAEAGGFFAGIAYEKIDNSAGAASAVNCRVSSKGAYSMVMTGVALTDIGSVVYASDDQTVSTTQGANEIAVGVVIEVLGTNEALVKIDNHAL